MRACSPRRLLVLAALAAWIPPASFAAEPRKPNVVLLYADDLGYGDLPPIRRDELDLPNFKRLAREGGTFRNFHVAQPVCTASRVALLTGCYPNRLGMHGAMSPKSTHGIAARETTLAESLKSAGYATGIAGKWHLGHRRPSLPTHHGFDEWLGLAYSNDMWPQHPEIGKDFPRLPLFEDDRVVDPDVDAEEQKSLTRRYTERAVSFIERNASRPFFFYLPYAMPHVPLAVHKDFDGCSGKGVYADVLKELDWSLGQVLDTLDREGIADNTLVIFTSDNGPWLSYGEHSGSSGGLREGKGTVWEGGVRVPCFMRFPGRLDAGSTSDAMFLTIDLLPTIVKLVGGQLPSLPIDGLDVWDLVRGVPGARNPHPAYAYYYEANELQAVVNGDGRWKLVLPHTYRTLGPKPGGKDGLPVKYQHVTLKKPELYDLAADRDETRDVAAEHPDVVQELLGRAEEFRSELGDRLTNRAGAGARAPDLTDLPGPPGFQAHFADETLRVDYVHGGDAKTEWATFDRFHRQGIWAGSRTHLIDPFEVGRSVVEVRSKDGKELLFSRRFDTYFGEYRTTEAAEKGVARSYHESALVPYPTAEARILIKVRQRDRTHKTILDVPFDPKSETIAQGLASGVQVIPVQDAGDPHRKVDMVIVPEGYTKADEAKLRADLKRFVGIFQSLEPFGSRKDMFNMLAAWRPSAESGTDEPGRGVWRDTAVGTSFDSLSSERYLLTEDNRALRDIAAHAPYDTIYVMVNHPRYGGGGIYNLFCTFTTDNQWAPYLFLHEFGHSFAGLADEYYSSSVAYNDFYPKGIEPEEPNITALLDPKKLKWADLATPGVAISTPWEKAEFDVMDNAFQKVREATNKKIAESMRSGAPAETVAKFKAEMESLSLDHAKKMDAHLARSKFVGKVGAFEGAGYSSTGLYRSSLDCLMFSKGSKPFCSACSRAVNRTIDHYSE